MSVYVDDMRRPARPPGYRGPGTPRWSHLVADSHEELIRFARRLGLNLTWIQHQGAVIEHFDVTETVRKHALRLGALPISYGRESGLLTMLKRARSDGDTARAAAVRAELAAIGSVIR
jgi:hypothetical protein